MQNSEHDYVDKIKRLRDAILDDFNNKKITKKEAEKILKWTLVIEKKHELV